MMKTVMGKGGDKIKPKESKATIRKSSVEAAGKPKAPAAVQTQESMKSKGTVQRGNKVSKEVGSKKRKSESDKGPVTAENVVVMRVDHGRIHVASGLSSVQGMSCGNGQQKVGDSHEVMFDAEPVAGNIEGESIVQNSATETVKRLVQKKGISTMKNAVDQVNHYGSETISTKPAGVLVVDTAVDQNQISVAEKMSKVRKVPITSIMQDKVSFDAEDMDADETNAMDNDESSNETDQNTANSEKVSEDRESFNKSDGDEFDEEESGKSEEDSQDSKEHLISAQEDSAHEPDERPTEHTLGVVYKKMKLCTGRANLNIAGVNVNGIWFRNLEAAGYWDDVVQRTIVHEKLWADSRYKAKNIHQLIEGAGMLMSLQKSKAFPVTLVREIVANLPTGFSDKKSNDYGLVLVRGQRAEITPSVINEYLELLDSSDDSLETDYNKMARILTGGKRSIWGDNTIPSNTLTVKYALLYFIGIYNWIPGKSRAYVTKPMGHLLHVVGKGKGLHLGAAIHNHLASHAGANRTSQCIVFPSLLAELVLKQLPGLLTKEDTMSSKPKTFTSDHKLFAASRVNDLEEEVQFKKKLAVVTFQREKTVKSSDGDRARLLAAVDEELEHLTQVIKQHLARKKALTELAREIRYPSVDDITDEEVQSESFDQ